MGEIEEYGDQVLLEEIHKGDEKAFNTLFQRYRNQLFVYLHKITKSREASEEIVLDVFVKIWLGRQIVGEIRHFESFLFRIAHNKGIDFLRSARHQPVLLEEIWENMQHTISAEQADKRLQRLEVEHLLHQAIHELPPQKQKVFKMSREEGLSYDQIAQKLELSRNTVRNHMAAALEFIRTYLQDKGYGMTVLAITLNSWYQK